MNISNLDRALELKILMLDIEHNINVANKMIKDKVFHITLNSNKNAGASRFKIMQDGENYALFYNKVSKKMIEELNNMKRDIEEEIREL